MKETTYTVSSNEPARAILVSLILQKDKRNEENSSFSLHELIQLAETAGVEVLESMSQVKEKIDAKWYIGKGKVEELKVKITELHANIAIFDQELSGGQVRNLEQALDVKIIDRTQLILDIFAQRARTREGITQVELAQLKYLLPRLLGQGKNLSRLAGGIGSRGPGESQLETDRRHIHRRIDELKAHLAEIAKHRHLHRAHRKKSGLFQIALVGYTNAGKSTLLNQLTNSTVLVENQLFATLDPTSRTMVLPGGKKLVITDTVGFIQNLPHDLVASFRATLEEVNEADLILHVVDSSSSMRNEQMRVVNQVLEQLGAHQKEQWVIFNKIDCCTSLQAEMIHADVPFVKMSAYAAKDVNYFISLLEKKFMSVLTTFRLPVDRGDLHSLVYRIGNVQEIRTDEEAICFDVQLNQQDYEKWGHSLHAFDQNNLQK